MVAPFTGAWIEIVVVKETGIVDEGVAPFTGAWIEIESQYFNLLFWKWSHPSRVRGLKYRLVSESGLFLPVAPFTGAWIEMQSGSPVKVLAVSSHPSRVRGLK